MTKRSLALICLVFLGLSNSGWCAKIIRPWRATTAIVKAGDTFEVWFDANSGQSVNSVTLVGDYNSVSTSISKQTGSWVYDKLSNNKYDTKVTVRVPANAPADRYDLVLNTSSGKETSPKAVKVVKEFKDNYYVMHFSDVHRAQGGYDEVHTLRKVSEMIKIANIMDVQILWETGDNQYNVRNNTYREDYYYNGVASQGVLGIHDASAATFMSAGNHDSPNNDFKRDANVAESADFFNQYYGLHIYSFKYGNGRFLSVNNAWGGDSDTGTQARDFNAWMDQVGSGNFIMAGSHCKEEAIEYFYARCPVDLSVVGHSHFAASGNPYRLDGDRGTDNVGNPVQYVADSVRDVGNFEFNLFRVNNNTGNYDVIGGSSSRVKVIQDSTQSLIADSSRWVSNLELSYSKSNNGTKSDNRATIVNRYNFPIYDAHVRFVMPKGANYNVQPRTVIQQFDGSQYRIVDVNVNIGAKSTVNVDISTGEIVGDTTPPVVSFNSPSGNTSVNAGSDMVVVVDASDSSGVERVSLYKNNVLVRNDIAAPYTWNDPELQNLQEGSFVLKAVARDTSGNESQTSITVTVNAGQVSTPPVVSFASPSGNVTLDEGGDLYVKVNASDEDGIQRVYLSKDGIEIRGEGGAPYEWNAAGQNDTELQNLAAGTFTLTARAVDNAGDEATTSITVTVKSVQVSTPPAVSFASPSGNVTLNAGDDLYVKVDASDADGIERVWLSKDGVEIRGEGGAPYEWNGEGQDDLELRNLAAGSFVLTARAVDNSGAESTTSINVTVGAPNAGPVVTFDTPSGNVSLSEGDDLYVNVNVSDPDGFGRVYLFKNGVELARSEGGAPYEWGAEGQNDPEISNLSAGTFVLTAQSTDNLGNLGVSAPLTVTVEGGAVSEGPVVSFNTPAGNTTLNEGDDLYVKVDATDPDGVQRLYLYMNGVMIRGEGAAPYEWGAPDQNDPALQNMQAGSYVFRVVAKDNLGNENDASILVTVNSAAGSMVQNGSFATGSTSWDLTGSAAINGGALQLTSASSYAKQTVPTVSGTTYNIRVRIDASAMSSGKAVFDTQDEYDGPGQGQFVMYDKNSGWTEYTGSFTATDDSFVLRMFTTSSFIGTILFDDVKLIPTTRSASDALAAGYDSWAASKNIGDSDVDSDGDGMDNLMEYALGGDPKKASDRKGPELVKTGNGFEYRHRRRNDDSSLIYKVEVCTNLTEGVWTEVGAGAETVVVDSEYNDVVHQLDADPSQSYIRLRVQK